MDSYMIGSRDFRRHDLEEIERSLRAMPALEPRARNVLLDMLDVFREQAPLAEQAEARGETAAELEKENVQLREERDADAAQLEAALGAVEALARVYGFTTVGVKRLEQLEELEQEIVPIRARAARVPGLLDHIAQLEAQNLALILA